MKIRAAYQTRLLIGLVIALFGLLRLRLMYLPILDIGLPTPVGTDAAVHLTMITKILHGEQHLFVDGYPQGFHYLVAGLVRLTGLSPVSMVVGLMPLLALASVAAIGYLAWVVAGGRAALITVLLSLTVTVYPLSGFLDGTYPNLLAGALLAPLCLAFFLQSLRRETTPQLLGFLMIGLAIIVTHHLTAAWLSCLMALFFMILAIRDIVINRQPARSFFGRKIVWLSGGLLILTGLIYWPILIGPLLARRVVGGSLASVFGSYLSHPLGFGQYREFIGDIPWALGGIGLAWLVAGRSPVGKYERLLLVLWTLFLFLLSRSSWVGLPSRFARELALPLLLISAIWLAEISRQITGRWQMLGATAVFFTFVVMNLVGLQTAPVFPDQVLPLVTFSRANADTAQLISELLPEGAVVLTTPATPVWSVLAQRTMIPLEVNETKTPETITETIARTKATYLLLIPKPESNPAEEVYPYLAHFATVKEQLSTYPHKVFARGFSDGSLLFRVSPT